MSFQIYSKLWGPRPKTAVACTVLLLLWAQGTDGSGSCQSQPSDYRILHNGEVAFVISGTSSTCTCNSFFSNGSSVFAGGIGTPADTTSVLGSLDVAGPSFFRRGASVQAGELLRLGGGSYIGSASVMGTSGLDIAGVASGSGPRLVNLWDDVAVASRLSVGAIATISGGLAVLGGANINGTLNVTGATTVRGSVTVADGHFTASGGSTVSGGLAVTGGASVNGALRVDNGQLLASGGAALSGGVSLGGGVGLSGGVTVDGGLDVATGYFQTHNGATLGGYTTFDDGITINGGVYVPSGYLSAMGGATIGNGLSVTDFTNLYGGALVEGGLTAKGGVTLSGGVTANGAFTANGGALLAGGSVLMGGATLSGGATISNGAIINGGFTANGGTALNDGSTLNGGATVKGGAVIDDLTVGVGCTLSIGGGGSAPPLWPASDLPINTFTFELWVNPISNTVLTERLPTPESASASTGLYGQRYAVYPTGYPPSSSDGVTAGLSVGTNGLSVFEQGSGVFGPTAVLNTSIYGWTHVAVVYVSRVPMIFVNGVRARGGITSSSTTVRPSLEFGDGTGGGPFYGFIDEYRIWSVARSAVEISSTYRRALSVSTPSLVYYFKFDECSGSQLRDSKQGSLVTIGGGTTFMQDSVVQSVYVKGIVEATKQIRAPQLILANRILGSKIMLFNDSKWHDVLTVSMPVYSACKVSVQAFGDFQYAGGVMFDGSWAVQSNIGSASTSLFDGTTVLYNRTHTNGNSATDGSGAGVVVFTQWISDPYVNNSIPRNHILQLRTSIDPYGIVVSGAHGWVPTITYDVAGQFVNVF
eukprot:TRINITY_DN10726_c0_g1_i1.p1 TRINITY_DN10726_c0_g1~~TRINITY_DN10726_c0_g1_i1.p1  ORF type:complete len:817 (+),score=138.78 TRINITY_DN10726_c0_g1_i1:1089-3539(+)